MPSSAAARCWPASLVIHAQGPLRPDFPGVWTFLKEPDGPVFQQAVLGDRFTVEQSATALLITGPVDGEALGGSGYSQRFSLYVSIQRVRYIRAAVRHCESRMGWP